MAVGVGMDSGGTHPELIKSLFFRKPVSDGGDVCRQSEAFLHMAPAIIVLACNPANGYLVALGGCIEPGRLDLITGNDFLTGNVGQGLVRDRNRFFLLLLLLSVGTGGFRSVTEHHLVIRAAFQHGLDVGTADDSHAAADA